MKKILFLFLVIFFVSNAFAQTFKYVSEYDVVENDITKSFEGQVVQLEAIQVATFTGFKFRLMHLDNNLKPIDKVKVEVEDGIAIFSSSLLKMNNNLYLIYWGRIRKTDLFFVKTRKINPVTLSVDAPVQIMETDQTPSVSILADFDYKFNNDSSLLILTLASKSSSLKTKKYSLQVVDNNLKSVFKRNIELPIKNEFILPQSIDYSATEKAMYISYKYYEGAVDSYFETQYTKKIPNYSYNLLKVGENNEKPISINVQNNIIHKMNLEIEPDNKIFVSGPLKKTCMANVHALFYGYLNTLTNKIDEVKIINYSDDIIKAVEQDGYKPVKNETVGMSPFFRPIYSLKRDNGSIDIVCEYIYILQNLNGRGAFNEYTYGDIVNTNIATNGKATFTRVPKSQYNVDHSSYLGAFATSYKNKLLLLYNDSKGNLTKDINDKPSTVERFGFRTSMLMQATIDENGVVSKQNVDGANQNNFIVIPETIRRINSKSFTVKSTNENFFTYKYKFGFLELK